MKEKKNVIDLVMITAGSQGEIDKKHIPLGLLYIGSILKKHGYEINILHLLPNEFNNAIEKIQNDNPLWVGISVLSGMTTYYAADFSRMVKKNFPNIPIVWGGRHPSAMPYQCLEEDFIDIVCIGEGEYTCLDLTEQIENKLSLESVKGIGFKKNGKIIINPERKLIAELDELEIDWSLVDLFYYIIDNNDKKTVSFYSSRGCPYQCAFCSTPTFSGKSYRSHSVDFIVNHLLFLRKKYGINSVFFSDDNFMFNKHRGLEIIRRLNDIGIAVDTLDIRLDQIDEELLEELSNLGTSGLFFGWESGNDRILKLLRKRIDISQILDKVELIAKYNLRVWASGIIGVPTETHEEFCKTISFAMKLRDILPSGSTVSTYRYMPLPKTELLNYAIKDGFQLPKKTEDWKIIDPIGSYYKVSWLNWLTPEEEVKMAIYQEISRDGILNKVEHLKAKKFAIIIHNFFRIYMNKKILANECPNLLGLQVYRTFHNLYSYWKYRKKKGLQSDALKKFLL